MFVDIPSNFRGTLKLKKSWNFNGHLNTWIPSTHMFVSWNQFRQH